MPIKRFAAATDPAAAAAAAAADLRHPLQLAAVPE
jgi:hypothetical protein